MPIDPTPLLTRLQDAEYVCKLGLNYCTAPPDHEDYRAVLRLCIECLNNIHHAMAAAQSIIDNWPEEPPP